MLIYICNASNVPSAHVFGIWGCSLQGYMNILLAEVIGVVPPYVHLFLHISTNLIGHTQGTPSYSVTANSIQLEKMLCCLEWHVYNYGVYMYILNVYVHVHV